MSSRAWSMGKTDRCKLFWMDLLNLSLYTIVKITAEIKKNIDTQNVAPGTYENSLKNKK